MQGMEPTFNAATTPEGQPLSRAIIRRARARCRCAVSALHCPKSSSTSVPSSCIYHFRVQGVNEKKSPLHCRFTHIVQLLNSAPLAGTVLHRKCTNNNLFLDSYLQEQVAGVGVGLEEPLLQHGAAEGMQQVSHRTLRTLAHSWRQHGRLQDAGKGNACACADTLSKSIFLSCCCC